MVFPDLGVPRECVLAMSHSHTPEQCLAVLLCSTHERRSKREDDAVALVERAHDNRLLALLERLKVAPLVGQRLLALPTVIAPSVANRIESLTADARRRGTALELLTLAVLHELEDAGIRSLPLKGSTLSRALYGDTAMRTSADVDVLVAPEDLSHAAEVVRRMGWRQADGTFSNGTLPLLHERFVHPKLPSVEVHWRVHYYETRFAAEALARAERPRAGEPLRMQPADELASLILFYARDGFSGLRTPADVATWWSSVPAHLSADPSLEMIAYRHSALAAPIELGMALLASLVGAPAPGPHRLPARLRLAARIANPFLIGGHTQISSNAALVDVVLSPSSGRRAAMRRHLVLNRPSAPYEHFAALGPVGAGLAKVEHALRVFRRWGLGLVSATVGVYKRGEAPPALRRLSR